MSELTHFYDVFEQAGIHMDIVSPTGGKISVDGINQGFLVLDKASRKQHQNPEFMALLEDTKSISEVDQNDYDVVYFSGGHGAMWDFAENNELHSRTAEMYEIGKVVSAVCHSNAALLNVRLSNGKHLINGKTGAGFPYFDETSRSV